GAGRACPPRRTTSACSARRPRMRGRRRSGRWRARGVAPSRRGNARFRPPPPRARSEPPAARRRVGPSNPRRRAAGYPSRSPRKLTSSKPGAGVDGRVDRMRTNYLAETVGLDITHRQGSLDSEPEVTSVSERKVRTWPIPVGRGLPERPEAPAPAVVPRSEEHTSELQSRENLVCRLLLE